MSEPELSPETRLLYTIFGRNPPDPATAKPATEEQRGKLRAKIDEVLASLTEREREIIKLRYGIGDGHTYTLEEIGSALKVTRERVRMIEAKALRKLQEKGPLKGRKTEKFLPEEPAAGK